MDAKRILSVREKIKETLSPEMISMLATKALKQLTELDKAANDVNDVDEFTRILERQIKLLHAFCILSGNDDPSIEAKLRTMERGHANLLEYRRYFERLDLELKTGGKFPQQTTNQNKEK